MAIELGRETQTRINMWDVIQEYDSYDDVYLYIYEELRGIYDPDTSSIRGQFNMDFVLRYNFIHNKVTPKASFSQTFLPIEINFNRVRKEEVRSAINEIAVNTRYHTGCNVENEVRIVADYLNQTIISRFKKAYKEYNVCIANGTVPEAVQSRWGASFGTFAELDFKDYPSDTIVRYYIGSIGRTNAGRTTFPFDITQEFKSMIVDFSKKGNVSGVSGTVIKGVLDIIFENINNPSKTISEFVNRLCFDEQSLRELIRLLSRGDSYILSNIDKSVVTEDNRRKICDGMFEEILPINAGYTDRTKTEILRSIVELKPDGYEFVDIHKIDSATTFYIYLENLVDDTELLRQSGYQRILSFGDIDDMSIVKIISRFNMYHTGELIFRYTEFNSNKLCLKMDVNMVNKLKHLSNSLFEAIEDVENKKVLQLLYEELNNFTYKP